MTKAVVERPGLGLSEQARLQAEPPDDHQGENGGQRHDAETPDLDQPHDHDLAEVRPVGRGVDDDQTGHTDRGRRGEDRGEEGRAARSLCCDRQHEETGPHEDPDREGDSDDPGRMVEVEALKHASTVGSEAPRWG